METKCAFCGSDYNQTANVSPLIFVSGVTILFGLIGLRIKNRFETKAKSISCKNTETQTEPNTEYILLNE